MSDSESLFSDFMIEEYKNISAAHFAKHTQSTALFRYYLLLVTGLLSASIVLGTGTGMQEESLLSAELVGSVFLVFGFVGLTMLGYFVQIRIDALHYSRVVNGVRRFFYDRSGLSPEEEKAYRVLPKDITKPKFYNLRSFWPPIVAFAGIDSASVFFGLRLFGLDSFYTLCVASLYAVAHFGLYHLIAKFQER